MRYSYLLLILFAFNVAAQEFTPTEDDYYKIATLPVPEGVILEGGGIVTLPNGNVAVSTRRGEIWIVENPYSLDSPPNFKRFASGLHEILGLIYKDGAFYCSQRGELTKLIDSNHDGKADIYETVYAWQLSGNYHEYSYGPIELPDGDLMVTANVAFSDPEWWRGQSLVPWRGWAMKISTDGKMQPFATGMRSPCGIGLVNDEFFYGDNQGDWMGSGFMSVVRKGDFFGHPAGLAWTNEPNSPVKLSKDQLFAKNDPRFSPPGLLYKPENIDTERGKFLFEAAKELPHLKSPSVWLPHSILGISTSEIKQIATEKFGVFKGQVLVGDQGQSKIDRVFLEQIKGEYQGCAWNFKDGFQSGVLRMSFGKDGSLFVAQTNRGWGSTGKSPYGLERLLWTGKTPFEAKAIRAMPDGFEYEFTMPVDKASAENPDSYEVTSFIYKYHPVYGSPTVQEKVATLKGIVVSEDGLKVRLVIDGLREKYVHELKASGIRSKDSQYPLLHATAYYTLNQIPDGEKLSNLPSLKKATSHGMHDMHQNPYSGNKMEEPQMAENVKAVKSNALAKRTIKMPESWQKVDKTIMLGTKPGLQFDAKTMTVKAGSKIKLTFSNNDDMPHNFVITDIGQADAVANAAMNLGLKGMNMSHIPNTAKVLFHTKLVGPGSEDTIYFIAPEKAGKYTYVCTVPGHGMIMRGTLVVQP